MKFFGILVLLLVALAAADINLHAPRGSNNKLNEVSNNVNNDNRLFDSQNNGNSGYHVGDNCTPGCYNIENNQYNASKEGAGEGVMKYHAGSLLNVEWTVQHGCGGDNPDVKCEIVIQYMCNDGDGSVFYTGNPGLKDGKTRAMVGGGINQNGQNTNPGEERARPNPDKRGPMYGEHESYDYYMKCRARERNKGLYVANRLQSTTRQQTAIFTRQGDNGERYGFECPEERDYYPYWHSSPWRDVAILTDDPSRCGWYQENSQNVIEKGRCQVTKDADGTPYDCTQEKTCIEQRYNENNNEDHQYPPVPNNKISCETYNTKRPGYTGVWVEDKRHGGEWAPECKANPKSRTNHLGNTITGKMASYTWRIPRNSETIGKQCVMRIRYNISSYDLDFFSDKSDNGKIKGDPTKDWTGMGLEKTGPLRLNINTAQYFRTFEDRTHVFEILPAANVPIYSEVYNLNVRGRRGNIVQVYPAVEYDFTMPDPIDGSGSYNQMDYFHIQWTGSDANPRGNAGNGRAGTDRSNIVQMQTRGQNIPKSLLTGGWYGEDFEMYYSMFGDKDAVSRIAYLGQSGNDTCDHSNEVQNDEQHVKNCATLNAAPAYFDGGLVAMDKVGSFDFMSTRNQDFTNRSQKASFSVKANLLQIGAISFVALIAMGAVGGAYHYSPVIATTVSGPEAGKKMEEFTLFGSCCASRRRRAQNDGDHDGVAAHSRGESNGTHFKMEDKFDPALKSPAERTCWETCNLVCADAGDAWSDWYHFESRKINFFAGYLAINVIMGAYGVIKHWGKHPAPYFPFAKAGGAMLNLNCALIFIPVCRNFVSWLRTTPLVEVLPIDDHILFHKVVGLGIVCATILHVVCHYLDFFYMLEHFSVSVTSQAVGTLAGVTGHLVLFCMLCMWMTSFEWVRRSKFTNPFNYLCGLGSKLIGGYSLFFKVHQLYYAVIIILLLHGPVFWLYALWPIVLLILERTIHARRRKQGVTLIEARSMPNNVLHLKFKPSDGRRMRYLAGQYLYLHCPDLSNGWHPFTISSSPLDPYLSLHIRCTGDFTSRLKKHLNPNNLDRVIFSQGEDGTASATSEESKESDGMMKNPMAKGTKKKDVAIAVGGAVLAQPTIRIDGPYGSASEEVFNYKNLILVGAGIGVTPFASIMRTLALQSRRILNDKELYEEPAATRGNHKVWHPAHTASGRIYFENGKESAWELPKGAVVSPAKQEDVLPMVHFYWICRSRQEFTTFVGLMQDQIRHQSGLAKYFKFHLFISGELELTKDGLESEIKEYAKWSQVYTGRPRWARIFKEVKKDVEGRNLTGSDKNVGVFLCGPPAIGHQLNATCRSFNPHVKRGKLEKADVEFTFHTEHF